MSKINVYGSFMQALLFSGTISVPKYFLTHYSKLGLNNDEAILIIHLFSETENQKAVDLEVLAERMNLDITKIEKMLANLFKQNLIATENRWNSSAKAWYNSYNFVGLIDELAELWAIEQVKQFEEVQNLTKPGRSDISPSLERIICSFEQELGRPLTEIECNFIRDWMTAHFSEELILEALKRGVSAGIRNFRYLDSILREWEKKGLRTREEVESDDAYFQAKQENKGKSKAKTTRNIRSDKYENFYL